MTKMEFYEFMILVDRKGKMFYPDLIYNLLIISSIISYLSKGLMVSEQH